MNQWYHLAVTRSGSTYTIYINGVPSGSAVNTNAIPTANAPLTIGMAEDIGWMNGDLDEMTIYDQALSPSQVMSIYTAGHGGKCKELTISTASLSAVQLGTFFSQQLQASFGQPPYTWSVVSGSLPTGVTLSTAGVLSGTSTNAGAFVFTIEVTDSAGSQATKAFTLTDLVTLPPPSLRITKTGTLAVPGRTSDYFILVENIGTTTATDIPVVEFLQMRNFSLISVDPPALADVSTLAAASIIPWDIASLAPGESTILSYKVGINPTVPIGQTVAGTACLADQGEANNVLSGYGECLSQIVTTVGGSCAICAPSCALCPATCAPSIIGVPFCIRCLAVCGACIARPDPSDPATSCLTDIIDTSKECADTISTELQDIVACFSFNKPTLGAIDPNQKTVNAGPFIQPNQLLLYPIHYENIGTAAAQNVYVTDVLDPNLDPSTLQILTPNGTYNPTTRTITWNLLGTNLQPGATADVLFQILPLPGLPSGTAIHNTATIQFDVFAPNTTNEVVNVIDTTPPVSSMGPLPPRTVSPTFVITWSGTDAIGSIATYTIFESVNGGPFTPYLENTTETQANFTGQVGSRYGFISIATDTAGNVEVKNPVADATILVSPPPCSVTYNGTFNGNLTVTSGTTCILGGTVTGNVTQNGGGLFTSNAAVGGNLQITGGGTFSIGSTVIKGNLQIQNIPAGTAQNQVCGATVKGNLQFQNNGTAVQIGSASSSCAGNVIGGNFQVQNNTAAAIAVGNTVGGNLTVQNNTAATTVDGNTVNGNLQDQNNTAPTQVFTDMVGGNLQCQGNSSITGSGDTAKQLQGQCAYF